MRLERELVQPSSRGCVIEFVNSLHYGGTEGQVVELVRGLSRKFEMHAAALQAAGPHLATLRRLGVEPYEVRLPGGLVKPGTAMQVFKLARWLRAQDADLVHVQDFYTTIVGVPAAKLAGARVLVGRLDLSHFLTPAQRMMLAAATRLADRVVTNAEAIKRQLLTQERLPSSRISVIPNGIDLPRFDRNANGPLEHPLPEKGRRAVVVHVANMNHPVKAQEDLLEAVALATGGGSRVLLFLVGDGPRRPLLEQRVAQLGIGDSVRFLGRRGDVPAVLREADIGVLCSTAEGLSNAIIEGMAASLPMVVTDAGGNRELVRDGESGFVVPVHAPTQLADRISRLVASPDLRRAMGRAGRAFVERELGLEKLLARHEALYTELLHR